MDALGKDLNVPAHFRIILSCFQVQVNEVVICEFIPCSRKRNEQQSRRIRQQPQFRYSTVFTTMLFRITLHIYHLM